MPSASSATRLADRLGANMFDYLHPDDAGLVAKRPMMVQDTPGPAEPFEIRGLHGSGEYCIFEVSTNNRLGNPDVAGIILVSRDVTDRHRMEASLHESDKRFAEIFETAAVGVTIVDLAPRSRTTCSKRHSSPPAAWG